MSPTHLGPPEARPGPRVQNPSWAPVAAGFGATRKICSNHFFSSVLLDSLSTTSAELWPTAFGQIRI